MIAWAELVYYDESSPTGLRWLVDRWRGHGTNRHIFRRKHSTAGGRQCHRDGEYPVWSVGITDESGKRHYKLAHQIVYELTTGPIPEGHEIDHRDGDSQNNKKENLRAVVRHVNSRNKRRYGNNLSGVTGVGKLTVKGRRYWMARWILLDGTRKSKAFSIDDLGEDAAFKGACEFREQRIEELNMQGAGYTEDHGVRQ